MEHIKTWARNALTFHHRIAARFLERRGWVAFYLPEESRKCLGDGLCWLELYQSELKPYQSGLELHQNGKAYVV